MMSMMPRILAVIATAAAFAFGSGALHAQQKGFSTIDRTDQAKSKQDTGLKPHPTPVTTTPADTAR